MGPDYVHCVQKLKNIDGMEGEHILSIWLNLSFTWLCISVMSLQTYQRARKKFRMGKKLWKMKSIYTSDGTIMRYTDNDK